MALPRKHPQVQSVLPTAPAASERDLRVVFAGMIRPGGRSEMAAALRVAAGEGLCDRPPPMGRGGCRDVLVSAEGFLGRALDVSAYYALMQRARFVLVPCGENPESYRLWETLHAGAIPIVELCGSPSRHPFRALVGARDFMLSIWDWRDLGLLLAKLDGLDAADLDRLQMRHKRWLERYLERVKRGVAQLIHGT